MAETNPYRSLPPVDELIDRMAGRLPRPILADAARAAVERARAEIAEGREPRVEDDLERAVRALERGSGRSVVNATGVLLHTNLGRARWSEESAAAAAAAATHYTNVEIDLETGERTPRGSHVTMLLRALTGAEDALVVNNNASALVLALAATSHGRAVPVSRGELIEIGGSYRLPDVMAASGARLVEVGTTNRTRVGDYQTAVQAHECGSILKVHPSNYWIDGFTETASVAALSDLSRERRIPLIYDIGSGLLDSEASWLGNPKPGWLRDEPAARQALAGGADLVTFSGDKLLGGPQAGIVVGSAGAVGGLRSHPLARALRVDGVTLAALGATLEAYAAEEVDRLPFWRQALADATVIERRARRLADALGAEAQPGESTVGAGSVPGMAIPTTLVMLEGEDHLFELLLGREPPILTRRDRGSLVIDLRTVDEEDDGLIVSAVAGCR